MGGFYRPGYRDGAKLHLRMMCLGMNWDPQSRSYDSKRSIDGAEPPKIPEYFIEMVDRAIQSSHDFLNAQSHGVNAASEVPKISPDLCIVNFYDNNGRLGLHQVLSYISICNTDFFSNAVFPCYLMNYFQITIWH